MAARRAITEQIALDDDSDIEIDLNNLNEEELELAMQLAN
jgi:hypothetical protein